MHSKNYDILLALVGTKWWAQKERGQLLFFCLPYRKRSGWSARLPLLASGFFLFWGSPFSFSSSVREPKSRPPTRIRTAGPNVAFFFFYGWWSAYYFSTTEVIKREEFWLDFSSSNIWLALFSKSVRSKLQQRRTDAPPRCQNEPTVRSSSAAKNNEDFFAPFKAVVTENNLTPFHLKNKYKGLTYLY